MAVGHHSFFNVSAGFNLAVLIVWNEIVSNAITVSIIAGTRKINTDMVILLAKLSSHKLIK